MLSQRKAFEMKKEISLGHHYRDRFFFYLGDNTLRFCRIFGSFGIFNSELYKRQGRSSKMIEHLPREQGLKVQVLPSLPKHLDVY